MPPRFRNITGFVLAGGASRRMGRPKHQLELGGETLLARQVRLLHVVCASVSVITSPENHAAIRTAGFPTLRDLIPHCGPLGGMYTGLSISRTEFNLFLGCDCPFVAVRFLRFLCRQALATAAQVTIPLCDHDRYEPLCAVYRRSARVAIRASLLRGDYKISSFFRHVVRETIRLPELKVMGFNEQMFANLNTPEDYQKAVMSGQ
jgi:molybdopterin-guanine dinucleotide biosynthesis protein A